MRPSFDETMFELAAVIAKRSTCQLKQVGAVVVDASNRVVALGYNGPPAGTPNCEEVPCAFPTANDHNGCRGLHAEVNAILLSKGQGKKIYVTQAPCRACAKTITAAGLECYWPGKMS